MAQDINTVTLTARLTRPPELRGGDSSVLAMRLAFTASRKNGEMWEDYPQYVDAVVFGRMATALSTLLDKGDQVAISGRLSWREWTDKDGGTRQSHEVICDRVRLLSKPRDRQDVPPAATTAPVAAPAAVNDEDIPF